MSHTGCHHPLCETDFNPIQAQDHTYPTTCHSYTWRKEDQNAYESCETALGFFHPKSADFAILKNTDLDCILVHNL